LFVLQQEIELYRTYQQLHEPRRHSCPRYLCFAMSSSNPKITTGIRAIAT
jgi:hypothetical protein